MNQISISITSVQVNDKPPIPISFFSENSIHTATILNIPRPSLHEIDKTFEFECLKSFFKIVDRIRVKEDEVKFEDVLRIKMLMRTEEDQTDGKKKKEKKEKRSSMLTARVEVPEFGAGDHTEIPRRFGLFYGSNGSIDWEEKPYRCYSAKMLHMIDESLDEEGFTVIDYPEEYPKAVDITNFIDQQGFSKSLKSEEIYKDFKEIYNEFVLEKFRGAKQSKPKGRAGLVQKETEDTTSTPLPLILQQYEVDLGEIFVDGSAVKDFRVLFHGGQVQAALRTESFIPGLTLKFIQTSESENFVQTFDFDAVITENYDTYRNRYQRELEEVKNIQQTVKRCHSFDFTNARVHTRKFPSTVQERHEVLKTYNAMMSTKKKIVRNPFVQSEIVEKSSLANGQNIFEFKVSLEVSSEFYQLETDFDELIFLDVS